MKKNIPVVPYDSFRGAICMALNAQTPKEVKRKVVDALNNYPPKSHIKQFLTKKELITALEKHRPACNCSCVNIGSEDCGGCIWNQAITDKLRDNFKMVKL